MYKSALILTIIGSMFLAGCIVMQPEEPAMEEKDKVEDTMMMEEEDKEMMEEGGKAMEADDMIMAVNKSTYEDYSETRYAELIGKEPVVLFFYAPWCPVCRAWEKKLLEGELEKLPAGTNILKVDYDSETDLKKKYGINIQSTAVVIDAAGEVVSKTQDPTFEDLANDINKSMGN